LVESVNIKTAAFRELFKDEEENDLSGILDYHKKHGGISRRNKIIYFYKNILKRKLTEERLKELEDIRVFLNSLGERVPEEMWREFSKLESRLNS